MVALSSAYADQIPKKVAETIKVFKIDQSSLNDGVLRVRYTTPVMKFDNYVFFINGVCQTLWMAAIDKKDGWSGATITQIETVNSVDGQGYAFTDARRSCDLLGKVEGGSSSERQFIATKTWVCVSGNPCRPRRDGERTIGDN